MRFIIALTTAATLLTGTAFAQPQPPHGGPAVPHSQQKDRAPHQAPNYKHAPDYKPAPPQAHKPNGPHAQKPGHVASKPKAPVRYAPPKHWKKSNAQWIRHVEACQKRYKTYNPRTDTYQVRVGKSAICKL